MTLGTIGLQSRAILAVVMDTSSGAGNSSSKCARKLSVVNQKQASPFRCCFFLLLFTPVFTVTSVFFFGAVIGLKHEVD